MNQRLTLFGAPTLRLGSQSRALDLERRAQLLAYLALKQAWVGRAELAALLWPDLEPKLAYTNLRKALHRLQSLPGADRVESQGGALRCAIATDVADFEAALQDGRAAEALALYRGPLLAGFDDHGNEAWSGWLSFERDRLGAAWRAAAHTHLAGDIEPAQAVDLALRLLEADPFDELALRNAMSTLARSGQVARARQLYREFVARLADELGLAPGAELKALHDTLGAASAPALPLASQAAPAADGFVGRAIELRRIAALLAQDDCRLLCLTGPGGVGKTRLAQRVLRECGGAFVDGATFVPLEDLMSAEELGGRLARELDVSLQARGDPFDQVVNTLRERRTLLVLDNFEQLLAAAPQLERLLRACPHVKAVVTSRVRLGLAMEWLVPLTGLAVPEPEDIGEFESFDSVQLFLAAAHRVEPALNPAAEAAAIVEICRNVEGLPLALELAASWTRVLSCRDIAAELAHSAELLQATDPSRPERHASLEAVFEQSWQLLGDRERQALAQLAVFRGGFTPAAARAVGAIALPVLAALVDKSLLRKDDARCHLHPLVQRFALARLEQVFDADATFAAHARYFLRRLADARQRVSHADREMLRELDAEFDNLHAAWRFAVQDGQADDLMRASYGLMSYCDHRGRRLEGFELLSEALANATVTSQPKVEAALSTAAAWLAYRLDRYAEAEALGLRAMDARPDGQRPGDAVLGYQAATVLGAVNLRLGRSDEARRWLQKALELAKRAADPDKMASALDNLGFVHRSKGELDEALRLYREALLKHREVGDAGGEAVCLNNLSVVHILRREFAAAGSLLREARALAERHGLPSTRVMIETNLANVALKGGMFEQALSHAQRALELSEQTGQRAGAVDARHVIIEVALRQGELDQARAELATAMSVSLAISRPVLVVHGIRLFAQLLAAQGERDIAASVLALALEQPGMVGAERDEALQQMGAWSTRPAVWKGPALVDLAHRIVVESSQAYAPLIAELRAA